MKKTSVQKVHYSGNLRDYQLYGKNNYQQFEKDEFTFYQNFLYKRALFGLKVYSPEDLVTMHWDKKKRIERVHSRAQNVLNLWKQDIVNHMVNDIFISMFTHSKLAKDLVEKYGDIKDPKYVSQLNFKDLGVTKKHIVDKLVGEKILPVNFYELV